MESTKQITDIQLVACLLSLGFKYTNPAKFSPRFSVFEFKRTPELEQACINFYDRATKVDALTLCENLRTIKAMVQELRG
jgi:hypothetical protein